MTTRHRLGAIELIELGGGRRRRSQGPYLAGHRPDAPGYMGDVREHLGTTITAALRFLSRATGEAPGLIAQRDPVALAHVAAVMAEVPTVGEVGAQAFLAANAAVRFAFELPGLDPREVRGVRAAMYEVLGSAFGPHDMAALMRAASANVSRTAPAGREADVAGMTRR